MDSLRKRFSLLLTNTILQYSITSAEYQSPPEMKAIMRHIDDIFMYNWLVMTQRLSILNKKKTKGNAYSLTLAIRTKNMNIINRVARDKPQYKRTHEEVMIRTAAYESGDHNIINIINRIKQLPLRSKTVYFTGGHSEGSHTAGKSGYCNCRLQEAIARTQHYRDLAVGYYIPVRCCPSIGDRESGRVYYEEPYPNEDAVSAILTITWVDEYIPSLELIARACSVNPENLALSVLKEMLRHTPLDRVNVAWKRREVSHTARGKCGGSPCT